MHSVNLHFISIIRTFVAFTCLSLWKFTKLSSLRFATKFVNHCICHIQMTKLSSRGCSAKMAEAKDAKDAKDGKDGKKESKGVVRVESASGAAALYSIIAGNQPTVTDKSPSTDDKGKTSAEDALEAQWNLIQTLDKLELAIPSLAEKTDGPKEVEQLVSDAGAGFETLSTFKHMPHWTQMHDRFREHLNHPAYRAFVTKFLERENEGVNTAVAEAQQAGSPEPLFKFIHVSIRRVCQVSTGELFFHAFQMWAAGLQLYSAGMVEAVSSSSASASQKSSLPDLAQIKEMIPDLKEIKAVFKLKTEEKASVTEESLSAAISAIKRAEDMDEQLGKLKEAVNAKMQPYFQVWFVFCVLLLRLGVWLLWLGLLSFVLLLYIGLLWFVFVKCFCCCVVFVVLPVCVAEWCVTRCAQ